jgi:hypothetical protein
MTEVISRETRWFLPHDQVPPIIAWFDSLSGSPQLGDSNSFPRQDYYLKMQGADNIGIKIREPKIDKDSGKMRSLLEVKRLIAEKESVNFKNNNHGYSGKWQKLSLRLTEDGNDLLLINPMITSSHDNWIRVDKDRILVKYDAKTKNIVEGNTDVGEGCGIELVKIKINNSVHYSFGLEAFSKSGMKLDENFYNCCDVVFDDVALSGLALDYSFSYPEFLAKMTSNNRIW